MMWEQLILSPSTLTGWGSICFGCLWYVALSQANSYCAIVVVSPSYPCWPLHKWNEVWNNKAKNNIIINRKVKFLETFCLFLTPPMLEFLVQAPNWKKVKGNCIYTCFQLCNTLFLYNVETEILIYII